MATIRDADLTVLLVVDVQAGVLRDCWQRERVVQNVARTVALARSQGVPVLWVQHADAELVQGSTSWQWAPPLAPGDGEPVVAKRFNSAFEQTALDAELARLGASHIVLAGAATNWCIRATAHGALERGYDVTLVKDAHTTESLQLEAGRTIDAADVVEELNVAMSWLSYPGRRNAAVAVDDLQLGTIR